MKLEKTALSFAHILCYVNQTLNAKGLNIILFKINAHSLQKNIE